MSTQITPSQNVAELLAHWPEVIPLFLSRRMNCVGCTMARFETLSEVTAIYALDIQLFLADIQQTITIPYSNTEEKTL
jgi:hybrid cluster-associated redox disulfide protein